MNGMYETKYCGTEYFRGRDEAPREVSLKEVDRSDLYVGVIGAGYGSGITEEEWRRAIKHDLPCVIYFIERGCYPKKRTRARCGAGCTSRCISFKEQLLESHIVAYFSDPHELLLLLRWM